MTAHAGVSCHLESLTCPGNGYRYRASWAAQSWTAAGEAASPGDRRESTRVAAAPYTGLADTTAAAEKAEGACEAEEAPPPDAAAALARCSLYT
jgi:hypothetical protein